MLLPVSFESEQITYACLFKIFPGWRRPGETHGHFRGSSRPLELHLLTYDRPARQGTVASLDLKKKKNRRKTQAMSTTFSTHSPFGKMATWAKARSLLQLVEHDGFVETLRYKEPETTSSYSALIDLITDMFHDYFGLNSEQRRDVHNVLSNRKESMRDLMNRCHEAKPTKTFGLQRAEEVFFPPTSGDPCNSASIAPAVEEHKVGTLIGPCTVQALRGRPASVKSVDLEPEEPRVGPSLRRRAESLPPGIRIPDAYTPSEVSVKDGLPTLTVDLAKGAAKYKDDNPFALPPLRPTQPWEVSLATLTKLEQDVRGKQEGLQSVPPASAPNRQVRLNSNTLMSMHKQAKALTIHARAYTRR